MNDVRDVEVNPRLTAVRTLLAAALADEIDLRAAIDASLTLLVKADQFDRGEVAVEDA